MRTDPRWELKLWREKWRNIRPHKPWNLESNGSVKIKSNSSGLLLINVFISLFISLLFLLLFCFNPWGIISLLYPILTIITNRHIVKCVAALSLLCVVLIHRERMLTCPVVRFWECIAIFENIGKNYRDSLF